MDKEEREKTGVSIPQRRQDNANKRKPRAKNKQIKTETRQYYGYEPTNIGYTFDSEYWSWKRVKEYWKYYYGEEENLNLKEILKNL
ncbi:MAG: hypothetical protein ABH873_05545 [Candidatus Firestonebacteria bacterium]